MKPNTSRLIPLLLLILFTTLPSTGCIGDPEQIAYLGSPSDHLDAIDDIGPSDDILPSPDADGQNKNNPDAHDSGLAKEGEPCTLDGDCEIKSCIRGTCQAPSCSDGIKNGDETDVDCGGPDCPPCDNRANCQENKDCQSDSCDENICQALSCSDGIKNYDETDIDCGGPDCAPCADGSKCQDNRDCQSKVCVNESCQAPSCQDGVKNGDETDLDCGGSCAEKCGPDQGCRDHSDCENESCIQGLCRLCVPTATPFGAGDGSDSDPYRICSPTHLDNIRLKLSSHFRLEDNIKMKAFQDFQPIGTEASPFTGRLDGNGFQIIELNIDRPDHHYQGLFGLIDSAELSNLKLLDVNITGNNYVGGLLGRNFAGKIINSYVTGEVRGTNYVGGLAGENSYPRESGRENEPGIIQSSYATGQATGEVRVGGLVGRNLRSEIHNSYAISTVTGTEYVGGLVGQSSEANAKIHTSYAISKVSGGKDIGGLVGEVWGAPQPKDSYWSSDACLTCDNSSGQALTPQEFTSQDSFPSWNFTNIWIMSADRPILRWEQN